MIRYELKRLGPLVLVGLATLLVALHLGISQANLETILFKFLVFCPSLVLIHLSRKAIFPYLDLSTAFEREGNWNQQRDAATIYGMILYYVGMAYVLTAVI